MAELVSVAEAYLQTNPITVKAELTATGVTIQTNVVGAPDSISTIAGDIFHNLRAALDLMACELARRNNQSDDDVYFPFCEDEGQLEATIKRRHFDRVGPEAVKLLKEWRPYKNGNIALRAIHDMDIQDKHRTLMVTPISFYSPVWTMTDEAGNFAPHFIGDPTKVTEVRLVFGDDSALAQRDLIPTLHDLMDTTTRLVESFKSLSTPAR